jgi:mRNA interferase MazF
MATRYVPSRGDVVWMSPNPQVGHEQKGRRPALVLSPLAYNRKVGLAICCPITSQVKGYPFEVLVPAGLPVSGAILSDQVKNLDWRERKAQRIGNVPRGTTREVLQKLGALLSPDEP